MLFFGDLVFCGNVCMFIIVNIVIFVVIVIWVDGWC